MALAAYVAEDGLLGHLWEERPLGLANFICPSTGECQGQGMGVDRDESRGGGDYGGLLEIAFEMEMKKIPNLKKKKEKERKNYTRLLTRTMKAGRSWVIHTLREHKCQSRLL